MTSSFTFQTWWCTFHSLRSNVRLRFAAMPLNGFSMMQNLIGTVVVPLFSNDCRHFVRIKAKRMPFRISSQLLFSIQSKTFSHFSDSIIAYCSNPKFCIQSIVTRSKWFKRNLKLGILTFPSDLTPYIDDLSWQIFKMFITASCNMKTTINLINYNPYEIWNMIATFAARAYQNTIQKIDASKCFPFSKYSCVYWWISSRWIWMRMKHESLSK